MAHLPAYLISGSAELLLGGATAAVCPEACVPGPTDLHDLHPPRGQPLPLRAAADRAAW